MSAAWTAYRLIAPCLGALAPAARVLVAPAERALWSERLGKVRDERGCDAWIHAASLGEAVAVPPLVRELLARRPRSRLRATATTRAGRSRLADLALPVTLAPLDAPQPVARFFAGVAPRRLLIVETELWPHWLMRARATGVPVAIVSARLSARSVERYRSLGAPFRDLVGGLAAVLCQGAEDVRRWRAIGSRPDRTVEVGNLKDDGLPRAAADRGAQRARLALDSGRPLFVMGSVRPGEAALLAAAWSGLPDAITRRWQAVAVPRHPRASLALADEAGRAGARVVRDGAPAGGAWRWDDRVGVLVDYYAAADLVFVGGSLGRYGGHNPIEPAACGAAVVMGADHRAQADAVRALAERDAIVIVDSVEALRDALARLMTDDARREASGTAARAVAETRRGAAARAVERLEAWGLWPGEP